MDEMEHNMQIAIKLLMRRIEQLNQEIRSIEEMQAYLYFKCEKHKVEREKFDKRLKILQNAR